ATVFSARDTKSDRTGRHLPAAGSAVGPLHVEAAGAAEQSRSTGQDSRTDHSRSTHARGESAFARGPAYGANIGGQRAGRDGGAQLCGPRGAGDASGSGRRAAEREV